MKNTQLLETARQVVIRMAESVNWLSEHCKTTNPTTALSQLIVAEMYNGVTINAKGYDVLCDDGRKIQVKARWWPKSPAGPSGSWIAGSEHEADLFVFVGFNRNYETIYIMQFTPEELRARAVPLDKRTPNKQTLSITKRLIQENNLI